MDFPEWTTSGQPGWEGFLYTSTVFLGAYSLILDERGTTVWYQLAESTTSVIRNRPRVDGDGVVYAQTIVGDGEGIPIFRWANWDGSIERELEIPNYTHDFVELSDGTLILLMNDLRDVGGIDVPVWGNAVVELSPDGVQRKIWSTWDDWTPGVDGDVQGNGYWAHANALDINEDETVLTVGFRDVSVIIQVDIATGKRIWQLGGRQSDFVLADGTDLPHHQHQFEWVGDELFIFDNRASPDDSRVVGLSFDPAAGTAVQTWEWRHEPGLWSYVLGDVHRRSDASSLVVFTTGGVIDDLDADGEVRWELESRLGTTLSYVTAVEALPGVTRLR